MKALVTGGAGFIGSHLTERLLNFGHEVAVIDLSTASYRNLGHIKENRRLNYFCMDIGKYNSYETIVKLLKTYKIDYIFHLAGMADIVPSINKPVDYFNANVAGTINMLEAARQAGVYKFVYASSSSVYGIPGWDDIPTSEKAPIDPQYPYAETKYQGERWVSHYHQVYGLPTISLRLFNVYGPRSRTTGTYGAVFGTFLAQKINGQPLTVVGDGKQSRDFVFVKDVCDAFTKASEARFSGEVFNVGAGEPKTILQLTKLLGGEVAHLPERPGEPYITCANISKIKAMLDWQPMVSFEMGVKIMLDNINYWKDAPVWTPETIKEATKPWFNFLGKGGKIEQRCRG
ncbi:MAG: SDR family NAD(P)-dependent oxidoreductase [Parcubacteria group bacterium]|nr:SDR family NAD(P)-dependent oxidoreductase [Parcubacteria group bacterium]